jgi:hypothetical protein
MTSRLFWIRRCKDCVRHGQARKAANLADGRETISAPQNFKGRAVSDAAAFDLPHLQTDWMSNILEGVGYGAFMAILDESPALLGRAALRRRHDLSGDDLLRLRQSEEGSSQFERGLRLPRS